MNAEILQLALLLFASVAIGGLLPYTRRWSEEGLHSLVALSAGIFLGTVFLHLVPELAAAASAAGDYNPADHVGHGHGPLSGGVGGWVWAAFAGGLAGLWLIERFVVHPHIAAKGHGSQHQLAWRATLFGLSVHALLTGLGLAGLAERPGHWALWSAMLLHKLTEGFSLGTLLRLAHLRVGIAAAIVIGFSLVAPGGLALGRLLAVELGPFADLLTAFAAGTFLFVALFELMPEVVHGGGSWLRRGLLVAAGVALAGFVPWIETSVLAATAQASLDIFVELAPYLLVGLVLAGILNAYIGPARVRRAVAGEGAGAIVRAALIGAPLPLCSCGVMPLAASLRRAGAGRGPTSAFLIATPETGPDSVLLTAALFGPVMTIARPLAAVTSAIVTGAAVAAWGEASGRPVQARAAAAAVGDCTGHGDSTGHGDCTPHGADGPAAASQDTPRWRRALDHALVDVVDDVAWPLLLGVLAAGLLTAAVPDAVWSSAILAGPLAYGVFLVLGFPLYICAAAATPIAAAMVARGVSPGAALVFLLAAPALNVASLAFLRRLMGGRAALIHVGVLAAVTLALGIALDVLFPALATAQPQGVRSGVWAPPPAIAAACAAGLTAILAGSFARTLHRTAAGRPVPVANAG